MWLQRHRIWGGLLWSGHPWVCLWSLPACCHMCRGGQRIHLPLLARYWTTCYTPNISAPSHRSTKAVNWADGAALCVSPHYLSLQVFQNPQLDTHTPCRAHPETQTQTDIKVKSSGILFKKKQSERCIRHFPCKNSLMQKMLTRGYGHFGRKGNGDTDGKMESWSQIVKWSLSHIHFHLRSNICHRSTLC